MNGTQRALWGFAALFASFSLLAQSQGAAGAAPGMTETAAWPADLPKGEMKGTWDWQAFGGGREMNGTWSLTVETYDPATGTIEGKLSFKGDTCNADKAPAKGTYKEGILTVNAYRGPGCHNEPFVLAKGTAARFEGRAHRGGSESRYYLY